VNLGFYPRGGHTLPFIVEVNRRPETETETERERERERERRLRVYAKMRELIAPRRVAIHAYH